LLLVERGPGATATLAQQIQERVALHTGIRPHVVKVLEPGTLPRTSSGKLRRAEALRRYLEDDLTPPAKVSALTLVKEMVKSTMAYHRAERP
jgi:hypothetical protein